MPEGNELHRVAESHQQLFQDRVLTVAAPNGRFESGARLIHRRRLRSVEAYGKHLLYDFGPGRQLHIHLGLFGKFREGEMPFPEPKGALRLRLSTASHWVELRGPTACEILSDVERAALLARIGPDPLRPDNSPAQFLAKVRKSRAPIAALLMDQSVISGIGNIFRAELLFRARLSPFTPGLAVPARMLTRIWKDAHVLMRAAVDQRIIVTTRPEDRPHPKGRVRAGEKRYVYRRKGLPCFLCATPVLTKTFVARNLFWCPKCQAGDDTRQLERMESNVP